ncbi:polyprenyl synthetase family protein [Flavobacteriales bacterium]|nr:polyprenyl synthetase family protein [Flavobacteriales bacterium]
MREITDYQRQIAQAVEQFIANNKEESLYAPVNYILSIGGKRTRPALLLMATDLFDGDSNEAINCALAVEVFHNFTLLHDDIMDHAPLRRGNVTVHERWGINEAILSGDVMMVQAVQLMMQCPDGVLRDVLEVFNVTAVEVCEGQQMDMDFEKRSDVSIAEYIKMIELKTSALLAGAMKIGALIGGATKVDAELIYEFGRNLGISFQIKDDILDVYGDQEKFGKQVGGDIIENKKTYLMLNALALAEGNIKESLVEWISKEKFEAATKVSAVKEIYNTLEVREHTEAVMNKYYESAISNLRAMSLSEEKKAPLFTLARQLFERED